MNANVKLTHIRRVEELIEEAHEHIVTGHRDEALMALGRALGVTYKVRDALESETGAEPAIGYGSPGQHSHEPEYVVPAVG